MVVQKITHSSAGNEPATPMASSRLAFEDNVDREPKYRTNYGLGLIAKCRRR